jgi:hypothetical protein
VVWWRAHPRWRGDYDQSCEAEELVTISGRKKWVVVAQGEVGVVAAAQNGTMRVLLQTEKKMKKKGC